MHDGVERKEEGCVVINVYTKCDKGKEDKKGWCDKKYDKNGVCVVVNVYTECKDKKEDKKDEIC